MPPFSQIAGLCFKLRGACAASEPISEALCQPSGVTCGSLRGDRVFAIAPITQLSAQGEIHFGKLLNKPIDERVCVKYAHVESKRA
jgi:hypothetical protein